MLLESGNCLKTMADKEGSALIYFMSAKHMITYYIEYFMQKGTLMQNINPNTVTTCGETRYDG